MLLLLLMMIEIEGLTQCVCVCVCVCVCESTPRQPHTLSRDDGKHVRPHSPVDRALDDVLVGCHACCLCDLRACGNGEPLRRKCSFPLFRPLSWVSCRLPHALALTRAQPTSSTRASPGCLRRTRSTSWLAPSASLGEQQSIHQSISTPHLLPLQCCVRDQEARHAHHGRVRARVLYLVYCLSSPSQRAVS